MARPPAIATTVSRIEVPLGRGLTLVNDWPWCLGVDLAAPAGWRSNVSRPGFSGGSELTPRR